MIRLEREIRTIQSPVEVRSLDDGRKIIVGYAAKFNVLSGEMFGFREKIAPGAFDGVLNDDVRALFNHDANHVLGRTKAGTLKLEVDEFGLRYEVTPPDTTWARDLLTSMERGDITQSSFAFVIDLDGGDDWEYNADTDTYIRTIKRVKRLYDVSPVTYPAYEQTESVVSKRGLESLKAEIKRQEEKRALYEFLEALGGK